MPRMSMARWLLTLICLLPALPAAAAPQDPPGRLLFQSHAREAGLGKLRINLLLQDRVGFIWAGTDRGVYRFDGQRFTPFGVPQGLPSPEVNALQLDAEGRLWVGTNQGLARFDGTRFEAATGLPADLAVEELAVGPDRALWVGTRQGPFRSGPSGFAAVPGWPGGVAYSMTLKTDGAAPALWVGSRRELFAWTVDGGWQPATGRLSLRPGEQLDRLASTPDGQVFARSSRATYRLAAGGTAFEALPDVPMAETLFSRMPVDAEGGVWMPTEKGIVRHHQGRWQRIGHGRGPGLAEHGLRRARPPGRPAVAGLRRPSRRARAARHRRAGEAGAAPAAAAPAGGGPDAGG
jgi:ligand-binding sensor domain-containing protein